MIGRTRSAALDYAARGVCINAVSPGMVKTPMAVFVTRNYDPEIVGRMVAQEPIGRFGQPEEIAAVVVWLCGPAANFMVGHAMAVDGGILAGQLLMFDDRAGAASFFHMFSALAEFERSLIRERTQAGLAAARRAGRTGGRPPKLTDDDIEAAKAMLANPDIGVSQIAHRLGVSPAMLYRYMPAARTANTPGV